MPFIGRTSTILLNSKATQLANIACVYCGNVDEPNNPLTDEHIVGRNFVPRGSLATGWSLVVKACCRCNNEKSDLEDDISAITLSDPGTSHDRPDIEALAGRKAKRSYSRRTRKIVADSCEKIAIEGKLMPGLDARFGFVAPPQIVPERVMRLARFHLQGFFYLITYKETARAGGSLPGRLGWVNHAHRRDWGNPLQLGFADLTSTWASRVV